MITLVACRATSAQPAVPFLQAAAHPGGSSNVNLSQALIEALQQLESSLTQKLDAQTSSLQGQLNGLTQDLGERRERALLRARRGQRITDVLVIDAASALTQLLATLKPARDTKPFEQRMLQHLFDKVGWLYRPSLAEHTDCPKPTLSGHLVFCCVQSPGGLVLPAVPSPAWLTMWSFFAIQSPGGVVLPATQSLACWDNWVLCYIASAACAHLWVCCSTRSLH